MSVTWRVVMTTSYEDAERVALATAMSEIYAAGATTDSTVGGGSLSYGEARADVDVEQDLEAWYPGLSSTIKGLNNPSLLGGSISQVGPLNTGYITFSGGVPVGGFAQLTLFQSGQFNLNGHFHVSGAPSYNVSFAVGVRSRLGVLYTFLQSGHVAGTFEPGSRDWNFSVQDFRAVLRDDWANVSVNSTWWWNARVNIDPFALLGTIKTLAQTVGAVASVVALL
jgi:hypothetical protein